MIKLAEHAVAAAKTGLSEPTGRCGCFPVDIILHVIRT